MVALVQIAPQALHLPGLARLNNELRNEVEEREANRARAAAKRREDRPVAGKAKGSLGTSRRRRIGSKTSSSRRSRTSCERRSTPSWVTHSYMQRGRIADHEVGEGLSVIERNAKVQAQIIEDLLDMSRITSGKVRLDVAVVDLVQVIHAAIDTVKPAADAKGIGINSVLDSRAGVVYGDGGRLQQVVWNILSNAIKFTPKGGRVQIVLEARRPRTPKSASPILGRESRQSSFLLSLSDFARADASTAKQYGGLGLGLSIVKQLVELHGGTIEASSAGLNQGATFVVSLPVQPVSGARADSPSLGPGDSGHALHSRSRECAYWSSMTSRTLASWCASCWKSSVQMSRWPSRLTPALASFAGERPDVVLSDIGMPQRDGYDLLRAIRALSDQQGGNVPAVALTALARVEDRKRAMLAGFQSHITKPVDQGELVAVVATLTGRTGR